MNQLLFTPPDDAKSTWAHLPLQSPTTAPHPTRPSHLTILQETRIWALLFSLLTIVLLHVNFRFLSIQSPSLPQVPSLVVYAVTILFVPSIIANIPILVKFPHFSALVTEFRTAKPVLLPPLNTFFVQIRLILQIVCFIGHLGAGGIALFVALELLLGSSAPHASHVVVSFKLLSWLVLVILASFTGWLCITSSNDELRSLTMYKRILKIRVGLGSGVDASDPYKFQAIFRKPEKIPSPLDDIDATTESLTLVEPETSPYFFDYQHQNIPFSPLSFLPHHDHYRPEIEPYSITTESIRPRKDPRVCAGLWSVLFFATAIPLFLYAIINVDEDESGSIYTEKVPQNWFVLLAVALLPSIYHAVLMILFPRLSSVFTTTPKSQSLSQNSQQSSQPVNLAASAAIVDDAGISYDLNDSLFTSMISPASYEKQLNQRLKHYAQNNGKDKPLVDNTILGESMSLAAAGRRADGNIAEVEAVNHGNQTHSPLEEGWALVPPENKHVGIALIVLQLVGFLMRLILTLGSVFIVAVLISLKSLGQPGDHTDYAKWIGLWSAFALLGFVLCWFSSLAIAADVKSYNNHDKFYNDWLMFADLPGQENSPILQRLASTQY